MRTSGRGCDMGECDGEASLATPALSSQRDRDALYIASHGRRVQFHRIVANGTLKGLVLAELAVEVKLQLEGSSSCSYIGLVDSTLLYFWRSHRVLEDALKLDSEIRTMGWR